MCYFLWAKLVGYKHLSRWHCYPTIQSWAAGLHFYLKIAMYCKHSWDFSQRKIIFFSAKVFLFSCLSSGITTSLEGWCNVQGNDEQRHERFPDGLPHLSHSYTKRKRFHMGWDLSDKRLRTENYKYMLIQATKKVRYMCASSRTFGEHTISWLRMKPLRGNGWFWHCKM